jgi:hypothetical protein
LYEPGTFKKPSRYQLSRDDFLDAQELAPFKFELKLATNRTRKYFVYTEVCSPNARLNEEAMFSKIDLR